jgi:hypothetical protein
MRARTIGSARVLGAALLMAACSEAVSPEHGSPGAPLFSLASNGIAYNADVGTLSQPNTNLLIKGFNGRNPHLGDAIVATFVWTGNTNIITSVVDVQTDANFTPVGNTYHLVTYQTAGGVSMATYVATNVRNFPDPNPNPSVVLAVRATLSKTVTDGGLMLTAWTGVDDDFTRALGQVRSATGASAQDAVVGPGPITVNPGGIAVAVTMSSPAVSRDPPPGFTRIDGTTMTDAYFATEADYALRPNGGTADPGWFWGFSARGGTPVTWLATVLALNPPPHLTFAVQPRTTLPFVAIQPAVQVAVVDAGGQTVTGFSGQVTIAIGHNGGTVAPGTLSGTKTVNVVNGVATFSDLSIDQVGNGYTLVVSASGVKGAESVAFNIGAF